MAYISANEVKAIRTELKAEFGKDIKFSVTKQHDMKVNVCIMSSTNIDFTNANTQEYSIDNNPNSVKTIISKIYDIIITAPAKHGGRAWFDKSDMMSDYFHTAYYYDLSIGKCDKPYVFAA